MRLRAGLVMVIGVMVLHAGAAVAGAATYVVNMPTDSVDVGGCTPSMPCSLRDAVIAADAAGGASTISLPAGSYTLTTAAASPDSAVDGDLNVTNTASTATSITITGAGASTTTVDATGSDRAFSVDSGAALTIDALTVRGGQPASTSNGYPNGGAVYSAGTFTAHADVFVGDTAASTGTGGAIQQIGTSALTVRNTTFTDNSASSGGAIADAGSGSLTVIGDTFGHSTGVGSGDHGNTAQIAGGAIADQSSANATISDSTFSANQSTTSAPGSGGGALSLSGSSYALDRDEFDGNHSGADAGAILWGHGTLTGRDDAFVGNATTSDGGAIAASASQPLSLTDTTFSNNAAQNGGALSFAAATPVELVNDTLWENAAGLTGLGNAIFGTGSLTVFGSGVQNTAIGTLSGSGITGPSCDAPLPAGVDMGHNLSTDGSCLSSPSGDVINAALSLGPPAGNGGSVATNSESAGQPTIDSGTNSVCPGLDARGVSRPEGSACDIGAYEFVPPPTPPTPPTPPATSTTTVTAPGTTSTVTTTAPPPAPGLGTKPIATTRGVLGAGSTSAFLGGTVNAHNQATSYMFQVGTTRSYGLSTVTGHTDVAVLSVNTLIQRLKPSTVYHYRLVAANTAGTSYGADRTFRTAPAYDGTLRLGSSTLTVHGGRVLVSLTCASTKPCVLRFSITIAARLARTRKLGTLSFTKSTTTLKTLPAHRTVTVSTGVNPAALALLTQAAHHRLAGKLSTRPRTNQLGLISAVTLVLK